MHAPIFIGIDLAWSALNPSGAAVTHGQSLVAWTGGLTTDDFIVGYIERFLGTDDTPCIVAVDATLRVPNLTGARLCDRD